MSVLCLELTLGEISNPGEDDARSAAGEGDNEDTPTAQSARPMGQLVLRFSWVNPGEGGGEKDEAGGTAGHSTLVVHGASGLAKADL